MSVIGELTKVSKVLFRVRRLLMSLAVSALPIAQNAAWQEDTNNAVFHGPANKNAQARELGRCLDGP